MKVKVDKVTGATYAPLTNKLVKIIYPDGRVVFGVPKKKSAA